MSGKYTLEIEEQKMTIKLYGKIHNISFPTLGDLDRFEGDMEAAEKIGAKALMEVMRGYLEHLGFTKEAIDKVATVDFPKLIAFVNNPSKKD